MFREAKGLQHMRLHLTVVLLFYGNIIYMDMQPGNSSSQDQSKFLTLFHHHPTPELPHLHTQEQRSERGPEKADFAKWKYTK